MTRGASQPLSNLHGPVGHIFFLKNENVPARWHDTGLREDHRVGVWGRIDDFDVTFSRRTEGVQTTSVENYPIDLKVTVIYRPIVSELYELDTEDVAAARAAVSALRLTDRGRGFDGLEVVASMAGTALGERQTSAPVEQAGSVG